MDCIYIVLYYFFIQLDLLKHYSLQVTGIYHFTVSHLFTLGVFAQGHFDIGTTGTLCVLMIKHECILKYLACYLGHNLSTDTQLDHAQHIT